MRGAQAPVACVRVVGVVMAGRSRAVRWWCVGSALVALVAMAVASGPAVAGADAVPESITDWQQVDGGTAHTCGLTGAGRIYCWGSNGRGALGIGVWGGVRTTPTLARGTKWAAVSAGDFTTCALKTTGRLFCWGADGSGQRGDGNGRKASPVPVQVAGGHTDWTSVSSGALTTCGIRSGRLFCWGADTFGALGNGGRDVARNKPVEVAGGATNWASVSVGLFGACAQDHRPGLLLGRRQPRGVGRRRRDGHRHPPAVAGRQRHDDVGVGHRRPRSPVRHPDGRSTVLLG